MVWNYPVGMVPSSQRLLDEQGRQLHELWFIVPPLSYRGMSRRLGLEYKSFCALVCLTRIAKDHPVAGRPRDADPRAAREAGCISAGQAKMPAKTATVWDEDEGRRRLVLEKRRVPGPDIARVEGRPVVDLRRLMAGR